MLESQGAIHTKMLTRKATVGAERTLLVGGWEMLKKQEMGNMFITFNGSVWTRGQTGPQKIVSVSTHVIFIL